LKKKGFYYEITENIVDDEVVVNCTTSAVGNSTLFSPALLLNLSYQGDEMLYNSQVSIFFGEITE
jgi:hypothetical protein